MHVETAEFIVQRMLEDDIDFELPKHRSEVRILSTDHPEQFDVTLLTGFDPIYIGTIGRKGKLWRPVRVMHNAGRLYRAKLHFVGYSKEEVAMAMVEVLRDLWQPQIRRSLMSVMDSEIDPKEFIDQNIKYLYVVSDGVWYGRRASGAVQFLTYSRERAMNYARNLGFKVYKLHDDSDQARRLKSAWHATGQQISESKAEDIEKEAAKAEAPASKEQAEAGNYKKGHITLQGLEITIENAKGSTRSGTNKNGTPWKVTMPAHYGYIKGTQGKDKDHLDVYIGEQPNSLLVYVVNQQKEDKSGFDEHKIMLGFRTKDEAIEAYDAAFSGDLGPKLRKSVVSTTIHGLKEWIATGNTKKEFEALAESMVESMLQENEDGTLGFDEIKDFILNDQENDLGTEFHIGFAIATSDQHMIEMNAADDNLPIDWDAINAAIPVIEQNVLKAMEGVGIKCSSEGHDSHGDLIGSCWVKTGTHGFNVLKQYVAQDEPFRTSSGTLDRVAPGMTMALYQGVPPEVARLIEVDISFFDLDKEAMGLEESDDLDPKAFALETPPDLLSIVQDAYNQVLATPWEYNDTGEFYAQARQIVNNMVTSLEQATGRRAEDGLREMLLAGAPKPFNYDPGHKVSRKHASEAVASFRACSKKVK
jgi:hypothetical protein